jgi:transcriptional regulator of nitric oxide reductase
METAGWPQEGVFLSEGEAPAAVFARADRLERHEVAATDELRQRIRDRLGEVRVSLWEERYVFFRVWHGEELLGHALIVEEIGKHRPITFVVGLTAAGAVADVAVMAYREAYGGEVRAGRFLAQYRGKRVSDRLRTAREITNIVGATLSVEAASRAVRKAQALHAALGLA